MDRLRFYSGDITQADTDAVVNAANSTLLGGGGVDGTIHRVGGPQILAACKAIRATTHKAGLPPGEAVITTGGNLKAPWVIHTVGPIWHGGSAGEAETLSRAIRNSLSLARDHAEADPPLRTISFPAISTGIYGYPKKQALEIFLTIVRTWLDENELPERVDLVLFSESDLELFKALATR